MQTMDKSSNMYKEIKAEYAEKHREYKLLAAQQ